MLIVLKYFNKENRRVYEHNDIIYAVFCPRKCKAMSIGPSVVLTATVEFKAQL